MNIRLVFISPSSHSSQEGFGRDLRVLRRAGRPSVPSLIEFIEPLVMDKSVNAAASVLAEDLLLSVHFVTEGIGLGEGQKTVIAFQCGHFFSHLIALYTRITPITIMMTAEAL